MWGILTSDAGLRTVSALHEKDEKTGNRVKLLERTADELDVAGAAMLGNKLRAVLKQGWGTDTDNQSQSIRQEFVKSAIQFMNPE